MRSFLFIFFFISLFLSDVGANAPSSSPLVPSIGFNGLLLHQYSEKRRDHDGFQIQEAELQLSSDIDPYFKGMFTLALHPEHHQGKGKKESHHASYHVEPEELFVETTAIPYLTIKAGHFFSSFGRENSTHTHALPFIRKSTLNRVFLGHEGIGENGIQLSTLLPISWFSEVSVEALQGENHTLFTKDNRSYAFVGRWKNFWNPTETVSLQLGLSGLRYKNETSLWGGDLTLKWRPSSLGRYQSFMWSSEVIHKERKGKKAEERAGLSSFVRYQFAERWYSQYRYEHLGLKAGSQKPLMREQSLLLAFLPSEFSTLRLQYDHLKENHLVKDQRILFQLSFSMGAHPAHDF